MGDTKILVPDGAGFGGNSGLEGAMIGSMMNGGGFGGGAFNNPIWALVFLAFLGNGFGGFGGNRNGVEAIQSQLNTMQGQNALMSAITGGTSEVRSLANTLNSDVNAVQSAINGVQFAVNNVANSVGMNSQGIINAVNAGNTSIITALKDCCCQTQQNIIKMGYENQINNLQQSQMIQNGFCQVGYEASQNANSIKQAISDQTLSVIGKIDAQESARKDREINALTAQLATVNARAERAAELAPIYKALEEIKGKQPNTVPVQWPQLVGVPASQLYGYGAYGVPGQWS